MARPQDAAALAVGLRLDVGRRRDADRKSRKARCAVSGIGLDPGARLADLARRRAVLDREVVALDGAHGEFCGLRAPVVAPAIRSPDAVGIHRGRHLPEGLEHAGTLLRGNPQEDVGEKSAVRVVDENARDAEIEVLTRDDVASAVASVVIEAGILAEDLLDVLEARHVWHEVQKRRHDRKRRHRIGRAQLGNTVRSGLVRTPRAGILVFFLRLCVRRPGLVPGRSFSDFLSRIRTSLFGLLPFGRGLSRLRGGGEAVHHAVERVLRLRVRSGCGRSHGGGGGRRQSCGRRFGRDGRQGQRGDGKGDELFVLHVETSVGRRLLGGRRVFNNEFYISGILTPEHGERGEWPSRQEAFSRPCNPPCITHPSVPACPAGALRLPQLYHRY